MNHPDLLWELARQRRNDLIGAATEYRRGAHRGAQRRPGRPGSGRSSAPRPGGQAVGTLAMCA